METLASPQTFKFELARFTPAELEKISGLSTPMQGDWRARGYLPKSKKHARFDAFAVAEIWTMKMLADRGIGPKLSREVAPRVALSIVWLALEQDESAGPLVAEALFAERGLPKSHPPHFIWWPNGDTEHNQFEAAFQHWQSQSNENEEERWEGAAIVLPLDVLGRALSRRAGRPLVIAPGVQG